MPPTRNHLRPILVSLLLCPVAGAATEGSGISHLEPLTRTDGSAQLAVFAPTSDFLGCLWSTDGTEAGTERIGADDECIQAERFPALVAVHDGVGYFVADPVLYRFWRTDGTAAGTWPLTTFGYGGLINISRHSLLAPELGLFFFDMHEAVHGTEPWVSDGSPESARLLADVKPGPDGGIPFGYVSLGSRVLFFSRERGLDEGTDLWRTDGRPDGTAVVSRVSSPRLPGAEPPPAVGDRIVFWAVSNGACEAELWSSDGTAPGTFPLRGFAAESCPAVPAFAAAPVSPADRAVLFVAGDGGRGVELWRTDGTSEGTVRLTDFASADPFPESFPAARAPFAHDGRVYFAADDGSHGQELWSTGTTPGTASLVADLCPGPCSSRPEDFRAAGERLLFVAGDLEAGRELWTSDGTSAGTTRLSDVCPGACDAAIRRPTPFGESLLFFADDGSHGDELWSLPADGAPARLTDLAPARPFGSVINIVPLGPRALFTADDGEHGRELWVTDGRPEGTRLLVDLETEEIPEPPTAPGNLAVANLGGGVLRLTWEDRSDDEAFFAIEIARASETTWRRVAAADRDATSFERFLSGGSFRVRVRAVKGSLLSPPSNEVTVTVTGFCRATDTELCLAGDRFRVWVNWYNQHAEPEDRVVTPAQAVPAGDDNEESGYFWFFTRQNLELVVKMLDGTTLNGHFWFFWGGLSDLSYTIYVEDTLASETRSYINPPGRICGGSDTSAFPLDAASGGSEWPATPAGLPPAGSRSFAAAVGPATRFALLDAPSTVTAAAHPFTPCVADDGTLCLLDGALAVTVEWTDQHNGGSGLGRAVPYTDLTGFFWFFQPENVELIVKALDGRTVNGKIWVFYGALSDVGYTIRVELQGSHEVRFYENLPGVICGRGDTAAF